VIPPVTARFQIVTEIIRARRETSPQSLGSDEVGLHTLAFPLFLDGTFGTDEQQRTEQKFKDIQNVDFDSGTQRDITPKCVPAQPTDPRHGHVCMGDEIDSQRAYDQQITSSLDFFIDLVKDQAKTIGAALVALGGISALTKLGLIGAIVAGIAAAITIGVDIIVGPLGTRRSDHTRFIRALGRRSGDAHQRGMRLHPILGPSRPSMASW